MCNQKQNFSRAKIVFAYLLKLLCMGIILLGFWCSNYGVAMSDTLKRRALLVGISKYKSVGPLTWAHRDAQSWQQKLQKLGFEITLLTDEQATLARLKREMTALSAKSQAQDIVIFVYAGHGTVIPDKSSEDGCRTALVPYDARVITQNEKSFPDATSLLCDQWLKKWVMSFKSKQVMVVLDSCFSGGLVTARLAGVRPRFLASNVTCKAAQISKSAQSLKTVSKQTPYIILTASHPRQLAYENDRLKSGIFTHLLLETLDKKPCTLGCLNKLLAQNAKQSIYSTFIPTLMQPHVVGDLNHRVSLWSQNHNCSNDNDIKLSFRTPGQARTKTKFRVKELLQVSVTVTQPTFIALCSRSTEGKMAQFFPNIYHPSYTLRPKRAHNFPPSIEQYSLEAYGPPGAALFWVIADTHEQPKCGEAPVPMAIKDARGGFGLKPGIRPVHRPARTQKIVWDWIEVIK
jgi:hypothetical protein